MGPASCMSASSWSAYMMISLKNVMQYKMDKEEKPHTPRNVSRIFMFTTALQCSILSLSLISLAGHHLVAHCAKSVQRKAACWPKLAGSKLISAGASALQLSAKILVHWPFRLCQHAILPIYISHRGKPLDIPGSPGKASNKLTKGDRIRWAVCGVLAAPLPTTSTKKLTILKSSNVQNVSKYQINYMKYK